MPKKYICKFSSDELRKAYEEEGRSLEEMCVILGVKSKITASKVLKQHGIIPRSNKNSATVRLGMTPAEFREFLVSEYAKGKSMEEIGRHVGITASGIRGYFVRYGITRRSNTAFLEHAPENNPNWRGGRRERKSGYIEVYCPDHPNANKRKCVYEHQLVVEREIGRYLKKGEVVHHIDGDKSNNNISNLLLLTNSEHQKLHNIMRNGYNRMSNEKGE